MDRLTSGDFTVAEDPLALFAAWFAEAAASEINDANAMALATVDADGLPNVRIVLLKALDERGFSFFTNTASAKGRELDGTGKAALAFHWKSLRRQVRARGLIERVGDAEADAYYATRPWGSRIGAWASDQSRPLDSRETLVRRVTEMERRYPEASDVPRPPHWTGYRLLPAAIEFWHDRPFRLHDRVVFSRASADVPWARQRLFP
ncbi:pyridoxamine 5'-phosphate oxidase [Chelatococcus reniformis]|uniref:Pyridoxine/pyridoxamine 5'-phosphate oxidase n=1 Tax=Chelatococcus reniformis TaxID=1494448 RepID=A0A916U779_9HYPH|nr:pyridoxamine 5'-phosphate oxidase [Chelatococcus reniformis]GGC61695.1 pyridoxine/pyridoxamine 5'-phosphate oxidase [Chelatococcus reniformis]